MKKVLFILILVCPLSSFSVNYTTYDNYTGWWHESGSWNGSVPTNDAINLGGGTLTINGFIKWETANSLDSTLSMGGGSGGDIVVNDTLVIFGNLDLGNKYNITVNGILIVYGNITTTNKITISSSGYLIVQGDMDFGGSQGVIESGDESNVYIGGSCTNGTGCANTSNDSTDLDNSDIDVSDFYNETDPDHICTAPTIVSTTSGERCGTGTITLEATASAGTIKWYDVATGGVSLGTGTSFTTPSISVSTNYYVDATLGSCTTAARIAVLATINPIPIANKLNPEVCSDVVGENATATIDLTALEGAINGGAGISYTWFENVGPAVLIVDPVNVTLAKTINNGMLSDTEDYYCLVSDGTCTNVATIIYTIKRIPETGQEYHLPNN